ncbi:MAG: hypothetical protein FWG13_02600 [Leptospirales bacterium]|nr:hypothetical protein [Leptospirales bacterium]
MAVFLLLIISCGYFSKTENVPVDVYVGGNSKTSNTEYQVAVYWKNGEMIPLETKPSGVTSIAVAGNDMYMAGYYIDTSVILTKGDAGVPIAGYWKNGEWVGLGNAKYWSVAITIFVSGDDVYAGGYIKNSSDTNAIPGYWKNGKWIALPSLEEGNAYVYSIFVSGNDVYAVVYSEEDDSGIYRDCYWKNGERITLSVDPEDRYSSSGLSMFVAEKDVYVGGYCKDLFSNFTSVNAGYWKNGKWAHMTEPQNIFYDSGVASIFVFGKDVYAAGGYYKDYALCGHMFGFDIPGYWKNGEWVKLDAKGRPSVASILVVPKPAAR